MTYDVRDQVRARTQVVRGGAGAESFTTTFGYDDLGNLVSERDPLGHTARFAWNAASEMTSATDRLGAVTTFGNDVAGRVVRVTDPWGGHRRGSSTSPVDWWPPPR